MNKKDIIAIIYGIVVLIILILNVLPSIFVEIFLFGIYSGFVQIKMDNIQDKIQTKNIV